MVAIKDDDSHDLNLINENFRNYCNLFFSFILVQLLHVQFP